MAAIGGPSQSLSDLEIAGVPRGAELDAMVAAKRAAQIGPGSSALASRKIDLNTVGIPWRMLQGRHPAWDEKFWQECRALYAGGKRLLGDDAVMCRLFPQNLYEPPDVYAARRARAHYYPYSGTIIDSLLAGLSADPLRVAFGKIDESTGKLDEAAGADWWKAFVQDVSDESETEPDDDDDDPTDGMPIHHFLIEVMRECMQTRFTWVRCEMPAIDPEYAADSKLTEEQAKQPYLCLVPAEQVIDWEYDSKGERLLWLLTLEKSSPRSSIRELRGTKEHHCYTLWTEVDWVRYEIDVDPRQPPADDAIIQASAGELHDFDRVPFDHVCLPEGLYAMGKLHSLAREHFNKRCAMSWAEYKALFPILYEFLDDGNNSDLPTVGEDANRATTQIRAQGYSQTRRANDKAQFIGPDVGPFKEARESCNDAMREMHRVMFSMALSANLDSAALQRSGDSKEQDTAATKVVLAALGMIMRRVSRVLLGLVAAGRGDDMPPTVISGLEHFDIAGVTQAVADAVQVFSGIPIKSKTFAALFLLNLYRKLLADGVTDAQLDEVRKEIEETLAQEELIDDMAMQGQTPSTEGGAGGGDDGGSGGDDDEREPPAPAPRVGAMRSKNRIK